MISVVFMQIIRNIEVIKIINVSSQIALVSTNILHPHNSFEGIQPFYLAILIILSFIQNIHVSKWLTANCKIIM